jgi:hypothetical protein
MIMAALAALAAPDLAAPVTGAGSRLSASPNIWLTHDFLSPAAVEHLFSKVPKDEAAYFPCIGQVEEFDSKRCTHVAVAGDEILEAALAKVEHTWNVDVAKLREGGLPIIRYLPGAPAVGKHGDEDRHGVVPNATLVMYLTGSSGSGYTVSISRISMSSVPSRNVSAVSSTLVWMRAALTCRARKLLTRTRNINGTVNRNPRPARY